VAVSGTGATLTYAGTSTAVPALRTGAHVIDANVTSAGHLVVSIDGKQVIDKAVTLPKNVLVGFGGATGGLTDKHTVSGVRIAY